MYIDTTQQESTNHCFRFELHERDRDQFSCLQQLVDVQVLYPPVQHSVAQESVLSNIPRDLLGRITCQFLDIRHYMILRMVCKRFYEILRLETTCYLPDNIMIRVDVDSFLTPGYVHLLMYTHIYTRMYTQTSGLDTS